MLRRLDRYVLRELSAPIALSLVLYVFLLLVNVLFEVAKEAVQNQLPLGIVAKLLFYRLPELLVICLPMAVLLGALIAMGRLAQDSEILALNAAGVPLRRLLPPVIIVGTAASAVTFAFIAFVAPQGAYLHHLLRGQVYLSRYVNADRLVPRVFHEAIPGILLFYESREPETGKFQRVLIHEKDTAAGTESITVARRGAIAFDPDSGRVQLQLQDGQTHARRLDDPAGDGYSLMVFDAYQENRDPPAYLQAFSRNLSRNHVEMGMRDLAAEIERARAETNPVVRKVRLSLARTTFHERLALPVASLVFALLALPVGVARRQSGKMSGLALSLAVVLVYWVLYSVLRDLAEGGTLNPAVALWIPNLLFVLLAAGLGWIRPGRAARRSPGLLLRWALALMRKPRAAARPDVPPERDPGPPVEDTGGLSFPLLIDRYVASSFVRVFVLVMASVYLVYLLVEFRSLIEDMVDNHTGLEPVLRYLILLVPRMTSTILPVACLVATLVGLGLMARAGEDTALKAAGVSAYRLLLTPFVLTVLISTLGFGIQNEILPVSNRAAEALRDRIGGRTPRHNDPRQRWVMDDRHRIFHYESASSGASVLQGLSILEVDPSTYALRARTYAARAEFRSGTWILTDAWSRRFEGGESQMIHEPLRQVDLGITPEFFASERHLLPWGMKREQDQMSYQEQRSYILELARQGYDTTTLRVGLAQKVSSCLIPVCMVLLGFPFAFMVGARGSLFGVGLAIGLSLIYWAALAVFNALGTAALLPPSLAAWVPNLLFGRMGIYLTLHVRT